LLFVYRLNLNVTGTFFGQVTFVVNMRVYRALTESLSVALA